MYVEFLGVPRQRAGVTELTVEARTLGQLLETLSTRLPALSALIVGDRLHPSFTANLNGDEFISDPGTPLARGRLRSDSVGGCGRVSRGENAEFRMQNADYVRSALQQACCDGVQDLSAFCILHSAFRLAMPFGYHGACLRIDVTDRSR